MKRSITLLALCAVLALPVAPVAGESPWRRGAGGWAKGPVELVRTIPFEAGTAIGAVLHDGYLYVTTWRSFSIYDLANPAAPRLLSVSDAGPQLINEGPTTNGEILLLSADTTGGVLEVWDVRDKQAPSLLSTFDPPRNDHMWTCVLDCTYAYGGAGSIVSLADPADPAFVGDWRDVATIRLAHTIEEVSPGLVLVGSLPMHLLDGRQDPAAPTLVASVEPPATRPSRTLPAGLPESAPGDLAWPGSGSDRFLIASLETPFSDACDERSGAIVTYDTAGHAASATFELRDEYRITTNGLPSDGQAPRNALGCSPLGVAEHPSFSGSGLVAAAWFEHGVRFLRVGPGGAVREAGGFIGDGTEAYVVRWADRRHLYVIDLARGIDVLRVRGLESHRPGLVGRVSVGIDGGDAHGEVDDSFGHVTSVSADGRIVAFSSAAADLVEGDTNNQRDVFVHDRATGLTERVSVRSDGGQAMGSAAGIASTSPSISADGRFVAFMSGAGNLAPSDLNGAPDVFVHDRETGVTELVSVSTFGGSGGGWSRSPSIDAQGRFVAFDSAAADLVADDGNGRYDVFVRDLAAGTTTVASRAAGGAAGDQVSYAPSLAADGTAVAFYSQASNLVSGDTNGYADVFVKDLASGAIRRASVATDGTQGNDIAYSPALSDDGRVVAFISKSSNLVPADTNGTLDVFVRDLDAGRTERATVSGAGAEHDDRLPRPDRPYDDLTLSATRPRLDLSGDGRVVAFLSLAGNLDGFDVNALPDVFVHDRETGSTERVSTSADGDEGALEAVGLPALDADGSVVAFTSDAPLASGDGNGERDVYVRERGAALDAFGATLAGTTARGLATFSGTVRRVADPVGDGAGAAGADLVEASIAHRPERGDVLVRWRPSEMPSLRGPATGGNVFEVRSGTVPSAAAGVSYGLELQAAGRSFSVLATPAGAMLCGERCDDPVRLDGSYGGTGVEATAEIPLSLLGVAAGDALTGMVASAGVDEVALGSLELAAPRVELGASDAGPPTVYGPAALSFGRFQAELEHPGGQVWARICLGSACRELRVL